MIFLNIFMVMLITSMSYFKINFYKKQLNINYKKQKLKASIYFSLRWERTSKHKNNGTKHKEK